MGSALEAVVKHDGRLDVLCCLFHGEPLAVVQLSARIAKPARAVAHYMKQLESFDLVEKTDGLDGEPLYVATLEKQPDWVREAVEEHRYAGR
jgi:hypothetical protein